MSAAAPANGTALPPERIAFPNRSHVNALCRTRANADNERWQKQVEQRDMLVRAAARDAFDQGERSGYSLGWYWGLVCGMCAGAVAVALLWLAWAPLQGLLAAWGLA